MATLQRETAPITAAEFARRPDSGAVEELVRGRIVLSPPPNRRHGFTCAEVVHHLRRFLDGRPLGRVFCNDSAVVTERDPDTVRGADVSYYSFDRLPRGAKNTGYGPEVPELIFEVLSPSDRWGDALGKVGEYLDAGVLTVVVLDPEARVAHVLDSARSASVLGADDLLRFESLLPGFEVSVGLLFE